jgi:phosphate transport system substrate-binding protein
LSLSTEEAQAPSGSRPGRRPLAVAALMVIYHVPGLSPSTHLNLNGKVLAQIFAGQITMWDDPAIKNLNPGVTLPGSAIVLVHRSDTSGST